MSKGIKWTAGHGILYAEASATHAEALDAEAWLAARDSVTAELARLNSNNGRLVNLAGKQANQIMELKTELAAAQATADRYQAAACDPLTAAAKQRQEAEDALEETAAVRSENDRLRQALDAS